MRITESQLRRVIREAIESRDDAHSLDDEQQEMFDSIVSMLRLSRDLASSEHAVFMLSALGDEEVTDAVLKLFAKNVSIVYGGIFKDGPMSYVPEHSDLIRRILDMKGMLPKVLKVVSVGPKDLEWAKDFPSMSALTIVDASDVPDFSSLSELNNLRSLRMSKSTIESLRALSSLTDLTSLGLLDCPNLKSLQGIEAWPHLTNLDLYRCPELEDVSQIASLRYLTELEVSMCRNLPVWLHGEWARSTHSREFKNSDTGEEVDIIYLLGADTE